MKCEIPTGPECPFKAAACEAGEEGMLWEGGKKKN